MKRLDKRGQTQKGKSLLSELGTPFRGLNFTAKVPRLWFNWIWRKWLGKAKLRVKNSEFSRKTDYFPVKQAYAFSFASLSFCNRNSRQQIIGTLPSRVCPNPVTSCIRKFTLSKIYWFENQIIHVIGLNNSLFCHLVCWRPPIFWPSRKALLRFGLSARGVSGRGQLSVLSPKYAHFGINRISAMWALLGVIQSKLDSRAARKMERTSCRRPH